MRTNTPRNIIHPILNNCLPVSFLVAQLGAADLWASGAFSPSSCATPQTMQNLESDNIFFPHPLHLTLLSLLLQQIGYIFAAKLRSSFFGCEENRPPISLMLVISLFLGVTRF